MEDNVKKQAKTQDAVEAVEASAEASEPAASATKAPDVATEPEPAVATEPEPDGFAGPPTATDATTPVAPAVFSSSRSAATINYGIGNTSNRTRSSAASG